MNRKESEILSKTISHALRHEPETYGLVLDLEGWCSLYDLVIAMRSKGFEVSENDIVQMTEQAPKKRHQISDGKIRAYYGHSTEDKIVKQPTLPPVVLYHGTLKANIEGILQSGLLPMERQYVHLSVNIEEAERVAIRRKGDIIIVNVKAADAFNDGIQFYNEDNGIWLSEPIPAKYLLL